MNDFKELITFKACCEIMGEDPTDKKFTEGSDDTIAYEQLKIVNGAINGKEFIKNFTIVRKYHPEFIFDPKLGRFVYDYGFNCWCNGCVSGPHLSFESYDKMYHSTNTPEFAEIWDKFLKGGVK